MKNFIKNFNQFNIVNEDAWYDPITDPIKKVQEFWEKFLGSTIHMVIQLSMILWSE